jgi:hypothetical protein
MLKETLGYTIHSPSAMRGNFFSKCKSFLLKIQAKSKPRKLGNQDQDLFYDLEVFKELTQ